MPETAVRQPVPASSSATQVVPDRLFTPSPRLGPVGCTPLAAVVEAERKTWAGTQPALAGVSAVTGEYGFLDLPDRVELVEPALAPSGEQLAYWVTGATSQDPNTYERPEPAAGVVVLDLRTGRARRHDVETRHGLRPGALVWLDDTTLAYEYGQYAVGDDGPEDRRGGALHQAEWWEVGAGEPREWPWQDAMPSSTAWSVRDGQVLGEGRAGALVLLDPRSDLRVKVQGERAASGSFGFPTVALGPKGRIALHDGIAGKGQVTAVRTGRLQRRGDRATVADTKVLPGTERSTYGVMGWCDGDVILRVAREEVHLATVDPITAKQRVLVRDISTEGASWILAPGLLETAEVVEATPPPTPSDPRWVAAGWAVGLLAVLGVFFVWRRRGHP